MNMYSLIFSGLVAVFTFVVAYYTRKYTEETRHLWKITEKSYFAKVTADHLFVRYVDRIHSTPLHLRKFPDTKKKDIFEAFRNNCYRLILEELFPEFTEIDEAKVIKKLEKEGYKFKQEQESKFR